MRLTIRSLLAVASQGATLLALSVLAWNKTKTFDGLGLEAVVALRAVEGLSGLAFTAYLLSGWPNAAHLKQGAPKFFALALLGLWLLTVVSATWSLNGAAAIIQAGHLAIWSLFALMLACADWPIPRLIGFFIGGLVVQSVVGLIQFATQRFVGLPKLLGESQVRPETIGVSVVFDGARRLLRAYALSHHPNILGGHAAVGVILAYGLAIGRRVWRAVAVLAWTLIWILLLITFSRSAWLAMVLGGAAALAGLLRARRLDRRTGVTLIVLAGLGLILAVAFVITFDAFLLGRFAPSLQPLEGFSLYERVVQIAVAGRLIALQPFTGVGAANFTAAASALSSQSMGWVHMVPLLVLSELGLPGLALFVVMIGALVAIGVRRWRQRSFTLWQSLIGGALAGLLPIALVDQYLWVHPQGALLFAFLAGLWLREE